MMVIVEIRQLNVNMAHKRVTLQLLSLGLEKHFLFIPSIIM